MPHRLPVSPCFLPWPAAPPAERCSLRLPLASVGHAIPTPGMCGFWEQTDSAALDACQRALLRQPAPGSDSLFQGDCGFEQTRSLDSL